MCLSIYVTNLVWAKSHDRWIVRNIFWGSIDSDGRNCTNVAFNQRIKSPSSPVQRDINARRWTLNFKPLSVARNLIFLKFYVTEPILVCAKGTFVCNFFSTANPGKMTEVTSTGFSCGFRWISSSFLCDFFYLNSFPRFQPLRSPQIN